MAESTYVPPKAPQGTIALTLTLQEAKELIQSLGSLSTSTSVYTALTETKIDGRFLTSIKD